MLHVLHSVGEGFENICVRTINTDVVVLAVASVNALKTVEGQLGQNKSRARPVIHALTGRDVVSSFFGKGENPFGNPGKSP